MSTLPTARARLGVMLVATLAACVPPPPAPTRTDAARSTATATPAHPAQSAPTTAAPHAPSPAPTPSSAPQAAVGPRPAPPPAAPPHDRTARAIVLLWTPAADLDLYVTGPDAVTTYFGNPRSSAATLHGDVGCNAPPAPERIDLGALPPGDYRIGVDFSDACAEPGAPVSFRVVADLDGARRETTGTLAPGEFRPAALVLSIPLDAGGDE